MSCLVWYLNWMTKNKIIIITELWPSTQHRSMVNSGRLRVPAACGLCVWMKNGARFNCVVVESHFLFYWKNKHDHYRMFYACNVSTVRAFQCNSKPASGGSGGRIEWHFVCACGNVREYCIRQSQVFFWHQHHVLTISISISFFFTFSFSVWSFSDTIIMMYCLHNMRAFVTMV